jgi:hypothetical protein
MIPQALRPIEWGEVPAAQASALARLGCAEATWGGGAFHLLDPHCVRQVWCRSYATPLLRSAHTLARVQSWGELSTEMKVAAAAVNMEVGGVDGVARSGAATAWDVWVDQRIDAAGRAMWNGGGWLVGSWEDLRGPLRGAAAALGAHERWRDTWLFGNDSTCFDCVCTGLSASQWLNPWLSIVNLQPGQMLRLASVHVVRAACRAHPLWHRRFARQWSQLAALAGRACVVSIMEPARHLVEICVSGTDTPGDDVDRSWSLPPQAFAIDD